MEVMGLSSFGKGENKDIIPMTVAQNYGGEVETKITLLDRRKSAKTIL